MSVATDLMGLGLPAQLAQEISDGGASTPGSFAITATGNTFATGATILTGRRIVTCSNGNNTLALSLPTTAGLVQRYHIVNTGTDTVVVWASSGVTISVRGTNTSFALAGAGAALVLFPVTATSGGKVATWAGYGGTSS